LDAKADILVYGTGETQIVEIARRLREGEDVKRLPPVRGTAILRNSLEGYEDAVKIPSFEEVRGNKDKFNEAFRLHYAENDPVRGRTVAQKHGDRFVIQFPPALPLTTSELDSVYGLPFARDWHPVYDRVPGGKGERPAAGVPGFETVRFSITSHRGCAGECNFCALFAHQGRIIQSRSPKSILEEVKRLVARKDFKGTITDLGGPTANLYGATCAQWELAGACRSKQCMMPGPCEQLRLGYEKTVRLWEEVMRVPGVKHLFIQSGLRYDLLTDEGSDAYLQALCKDHVSGRLKVAPEHVSEAVLKAMNKPPAEVYERFASRFREVSRRLGKEQYLVNYFVSAHPGSRLEEAAELAAYLAQKKLQPEQVQDFIPLPMTASACMYHTGKNPWTGENIPVVKTYRDRQLQRALVQSGQPQNKGQVLQALKELGRNDLGAILLPKDRHGRSSRPPRRASQRDGRR
nr:YgiQ family radical SAM protein [Candidatus Omnitrophota bacterium]